MITLRNAAGSDAGLLRHMARSCPPLDLHTSYTYWVAAEYFGSGSYILEDDGICAGYIMTVQTPETIFVWQIGILPEYRGRGLSRRLIDRVLDDAAASGRGVEVTIAKNNAASFAAFTSAAGARGLVLEPKDTVELKDPDDPAFYENEIRYGIKI